MAMPAGLASLRIGHIFGDLSEDVRPAAMDASEEGRERIPSPYRKLFTADPVHKGMQSSLAHGRLDAIRKARSSPEVDRTTLSKK